MLNLLFPPQCMLCHEAVQQQGTLCAGCWPKLAFISEPFCDSCGQPFDFSLGRDILCAECLRETPAFARARSVMRYNDVSRPLVTRLKYADQQHLAAMYGGWLKNSGRELIESSDIMVPVPLHYWRFLGRRYNQSALLAYALARHCGLPVLPDALARRRATRPQPGLTRRQRKANVRGAFHVPARNAALIQNKRLLLIDDVMTTRATVNECCKTLLLAGAAQVNVLTLARKY
jgi:ComF family protein